MGAVWRGLGRLAVMWLGLAVTIAVIAAGFALLAHFPVRRGVSVGYIATGGLITMVGVLHGLRPPVRIDREQSQLGMFGVILTGGQVRRATLEERDDALGSSVLFVVLGIVLLLLGGLLDPNHPFL
jgi:hypothetical protein